MQTEAPLAVTMGDPAGIGPEITVKAVSQLELPAVVYGSLAVLKHAADALGLPVAVRRVTTPFEARAGEICVIETSEMDTTPPMGQIGAAAGRAAFDAITSAIADARTGRVSAIVTAPINKAALSAAGYNVTAWDPWFRPDGLLRPSSAVNLGFVINVIEAADERPVHVPIPYFEMMKNMRDHMGKPRVHDEWCKAHDH